MKNITHLGSKKQQLPCCNSLCKKAIIQADKALCPLLSGVLQTYSS